MRINRVLAAAGLATVLTCGSAMATPTSQTWIPSTDAKALKEVTINLTNIARFSNAGDAGPNYYDVGIVTGLLPFESVKLEIGIDYLTTGTKAKIDEYPFYFNAKLATAEDLGFKGMPALAAGAYNLGTYDKPDYGLSTRQNIVYGLAAKTIPVIGRISAGGYYGAKRALANGTNTIDTNMNSGMMASWDRTIAEVSDKLWAGVDYMSGNNGNGQLGIGASWAFSKQITVLTGIQIFNPFYKPTGGEAIPGGKPAFTTQLFINLP
ncbi:MAG: hypothetical protein WCP20_01025 [Desulfuromonadales bacterium]